MECPSKLYRAIQQNPGYVPLSPPHELEMIPEEPDQPVDVEEEDIDVESLSAEGAKKENVTKDRDLDPPALTTAGVEPTKEATGITIPTSSPSTSLPQSRTPPEATLSDHLSAAPAATNPRAELPEVTAMRTPNTSDPGETLEPREGPSATGPSSKKRRKGKPKKLAPSVTVKKVARRFKTKTSDDSMSNPVSPEPAKPSMEPSQTTVNSHLLQPPVTTTTSSEALSLVAPPRYSAWGYPLRPPPPSNPFARTFVSHSGTASQLLPQISNSWSLSQPGLVQQGAAHPAPQPPALPGYRPLRPPARPTPPLYHHPPPVFAPIKRNSPYPHRPRFFQHFLTTQPANLSTHMRGVAETRGRVSRKYEDFVERALRLGQDQRNVTAERVVYAWVKPYRFPISSGGTSAGVSTLYLHTSREINLAYGQDLYLDTGLIIRLPNQVQLRITSASEISCFGMIRVPRNTQWNGQIMLTHVEASHPPVRILANQVLAVLRLEIDTATSQGNLTPPLVIHWRRVVPEVTHQGDRYGPDQPYQLVPAQMDNYPDPSVPLHSCDARDAQVNWVNRLPLGEESSHHFRDPNNFPPYAQ